jgi:hypothetical protein
LRAFLSRFIGHPVLGWYAIILLFTLVLSLAFFLAGSRTYALTISLSGTVTALLWAGGHILRDLFR